MPSNLLKFRLSINPFHPRAFFLLIATLCLFSGIGSQHSFAQTNPISIMVQQRTGPAYLDSTFNGLSYERVDITGPTFSVNDTSLVALLKLLGPGVLHSGGTSTEQTFWKQNGGLTQTGYVMTPADVDRLAAFLRATNWKMIYSLNFTIGTPPLLARPTAAQIQAAANIAAEEASYVVSSFGDRLIGFELGNEPDLFYKNGIRTPDYTFANYQAEWQTFVNTIKAKAPTATIIGPAASSMWQPWVINFVPALGSQVSLVTDHFYAGSGTDPDVFTLLFNNQGFYGTNYNYLSTYMLPTLDTLTGASTLGTAVAGAAAPPVGPPGYRVDETNAFGGLIQTPAGTEFGTALWAIDFEFLNALNHSSGVNFHNNYPPIATNNSQGTVTGVNPLYYGMKLFSIAANGAMLRTAVSTVPTLVSSYAVAANDGSTYVVINNKDRVNAAKASITLMQPISGATASVLTAPSVTSSTGVTLLGASIGTNGSFPAKPPVALPVVNGVATVTVPPGSAAAVHAFGLPSVFTVPYDGQCMTSMGTVTGSYVQQEPCGATSQSFVFTPTADGNYNLHPANLPLCLDWANQGAAVLETTCSQSPTQEWTLLANANKTYSLSTPDGEYCLNVQNNAAYHGAKFITFTCYLHANEQFAISNIPKPALTSSSSTITVGYDGECMDIIAGTFTVGPKIQQHACTGKLNELFAFSSTPDGYYTISSDQSQLCLDGSEVNADVIQNYCSGASSQKWKITPNGDGTYAIASASPKNCLGIPGGSNASGALFSVSACDGGSDQALSITNPPLGVAK
jgi:hypothetical protein